VWARSPCGGCAQGEHFEGLLDVAQGVGAGEEHCVENQLQERRRRAEEGGGWGGVGGTQRSAQADTGGEALRS